MYLIHLSEVDSTQWYARQWLAQNPDASWAAVVADFQTQGQGQWGRQWVSALGNLYVTYVVPCAAVPQMGLYMAEVVCHVLSDYAFNIKWPNDIFLNGKKCGGILCESVGAQHTLVGLGLNLVLAPEGRAHLGWQGPPASLAYLLGETLQSWDMTIDRPWRLPPLVYQDSWIDYTAPNGSVSNVYVGGLTCEGTLKVRLENGQERLLHSGRLAIDAVCT